MSSARILVVDEDRDCLQTLTSILEVATHEVESFISASEALDRLEKAHFDLVVAEQNIARIQGDSFLNLAQKVQPNIAVILITCFGTIETAVAAMREGAFDYLSKPIVEEELRLAVQRGLEQHALLEENSKLKAQLDRHRRLDNIVGTGEKMAHIFEVVESVAKTKATVLVTGESGTGKSLLARALHNLSKRKVEPFVEVNCGALPDTLLETELFGHAKGAFTGALHDKAGKFEGADRGTIFLDEISTASAALQVKLLRILQDRKFERVGETLTREVDVRLILATNADLMDLVKKGEFREDLYYRINVVNIDIPPLRQRMEDIPFLADHFFRMYCDYHEKDVSGFGAETFDRLLAYHWPGNIRELENVIERAIVLARGKTIEVHDLPPIVLQRNGGEVDLSDRILPLKAALEEPEKRIIQRALEVNGWNRKRTADMLEVNRTTLFHKMKKYGLLP